MAIVDIAAFERAARRDPEFRRETRYFTGSIKIGIADDDYVMPFTDGALGPIAQGGVADADCQIVVRGTHEHWENMLADKPKPFYQCLQSTAVKHGLSISASNETFAYLPALNRMTAIMRAIRNGGL